MRQELTLDRLSHVLPQLAVRVWPGSGHFPRLASPGRFARCLAAPAQGGGRVTIDGFTGDLIAPATIGMTGRAGSGTPRSTVTRR
jgi:hypothetical protein